MRLGIDFGTTRTRVAAVVEGNYPLITFQAEDGSGTDWYPSLVAGNIDRLHFGPRAQAVQYDGAWDLLRSIKRLLATGHPHTPVKVGGVETSLLEVLTRFLSALRQDLLRRSNLDIRPKEWLEVMVGVPANSSSNQRFLTLEAFRQAGVVVIGMLNEPSAAGIEYAHRYRDTDMSRRREHVVVYDLGGGTFDVAVICMAGTRHDVLSSEGIARLGGDDFDEILLELALAEEAVAPQVAGVSRARLLSLCREAKEAITANSRKVTLDFGQISPDLSPVMVPVPLFFERCQSLVERSIEATESAMAAVLGAEEGDVPGLASVYLVGGACELPLLARVLRERFGRRVRRSPYPSAATAIGLAIAADEGSGYVLQERFSRHFGVWREGEAGVMITFDPIFAKGTPLPKPGEPPLTAQRQYRPVHNVGRFRFLECSALGEAREPAGDVLSWEEAVFPFDPALVGRPRLDRVRVERSRAVEAYMAEETYRCDAAGVIEVTITNLTTGYSKSYRVR